MSTPITVSATINAPISKVWEYWTQPEHITQWSFASDDWESPIATNDLRVGGIFSTTMSAKDGSVSFDFGGTYTIVEPLQTIAYELGDGRKVEINFTDKDGETEVVETFDPETENPAEMQQSGWQSILNNFKKYVENN